MSGITMDGRLYTMVRDEALDRLDSMVFLKHVLPHVSGNVLVIWDGSPIHKGQVRWFLAAGAAQQIHVEQLPPYAPDLNPDEGVWHQLKNVGVRNLYCRNLAHLQSAARSRNSRHTSQASLDYCMFHWGRAVYRKLSFACNAQ
jgi:transposase